MRLPPHHKRSFQSEMIFSFFTGMLNRSIYLEIILNTKVDYHLTLMVLFNGLKSSNSVTSVCPAVKILP